MRYLRQHARSNKRNKIIRVDVVATASEEIPEGETEGAAKVEAVGVVVGEVEVEARRFPLQVHAQAQELDTPPIHSKVRTTFKVIDPARFCYDWRTEGPPQACRKNLLAVNSAWFQLQHTAPEPPILRESSCDDTGAFVCLGKDTIDQMKVASLSDHAVKANPQISQ